VKKLVILFGTIALFGTIKDLAQETPVAQHKGSPTHSAARSTGTKQASAKQASAKQAANGSNSSKSSTDAPGSDKETAKGPTEITATQEAQFDTKTRSGVFIGNVKVVDPQFTMTADRLTVHLNRDEDGGGLREAEADGHVVIVHVNQPKPAAQAQNGSTPPAGTGSTAPTGNARPGSTVPTASAGAAAPGSTPPQAQQPSVSVGKGDKAVYLAKDGSVTLTGWPQVTQGGNTHIAIAPGVTMVLYRDGRMQTYGSTRTLIEDKTATNTQNANGPH
jgi:lipopolysaccharide export system protein LptA